MALTNIMSARDEIIDVLRAKLPDYTKFILPLNAESEIEQNANFSPAIFVRYAGHGAIEQAGDSQSTKQEMRIIVALIYRDKRGAVYTDNQAGQLILDIQVALQGYRPAGYYKAINGGDVAAPYQINEQGAMLYPIVFKCEFSLTRQ